jgi:hypothetical protein
MRHRKPLDLAHFDATKADDRIYYKPMIKFHTERSWLAIASSKNRKAATRRLFL